LLRRLSPDMPPGCWVAKIKTHCLDTRMERNGYDASRSGSVARYEPSRNKRSDRREHLPNIDGRTLLARRWQQHAADIISDQGGSDISTARLFLCKRLAAISAMVEDLEAAHVRGEPIDFNVYLSMVQVQVRLSNTLGLNRRTKKVLSPRDYLASQTNGYANGHTDDEDDEAPTPRRVIRSRIIDHEDDDD
jgi:hypothetical protein